jgi:phosphoglycolate phosphatase-like HAD superfamily hydrolase
MPSKSSPARAMVFFDIDGTLIRRAGPHHREALIQSIRRVTGLDTCVDGIPLHGMLDPDILTAMMRNAGASAAIVRRALPDIQKHAQTLYIRSCPGLERKVCPGVRRLLNQLHKLDVPMGLVSGNFVRIGWKKIDKAGLKPYFKIAAFAGMGKNRAALLRLAIKESRERGWIGRNTRIALVGDTPRDIQAAKANRVLAVAVATGLCTKEELAAAAPDVLVDDLRRLPVKVLIEA